MLHFQSPPPVSQKVPENELPPGSPTGTLMERVAHFQFLLLHVSWVPHNSSPDKGNFTLLLKVLGKECPRMFPKMGPVWKQLPVLRASISISFGVASKGTLPPGSPHRAPTERDAPFPEPSFIRLSKYLVNESPSRFPSGVPMERAAHLRSLPLHNLHGPQSRSPHSKFPSQSSLRERCSVSRALLQLSEFLVSRPPMVLIGAPM
jgi:hypothetical protein